MSVGGQDADFRATLNVIDESNKNRLKSLDDGNGRKDKH